MRMGISYEKGEGEVEYVIITTVAIVILIACLWGGYKFGVSSVERLCTNGATILIDRGRGVGVDYEKYQCTKVP